MIEWKALSARIAAIFDSARFLDLRTRDPIYWDGNRKAAGAAIFRNAKSTAGSLDRFFKANQAYLSVQARACLEQVLKNWNAYDGLRMTAKLASGR